MNGMRLLPIILAALASASHGFVAPCLPRQGVAARPTSPMAVASLTPATRASSPFFEGPRAVIASPLRLVSAIVRICAAFMFYLARNIDAVASQIDPQPLEPTAAPSVWEVPQFLRTQPASDDEAPVVLSPQEQARRRILERAKQTFGRSKGQAEVQAAVEQARANQKPITFKSPAPPPAPLPEIYHVRSGVGGDGSSAVADAAAASEKPAPPAIDEGEPTLPATVGHATLTPATHEAEHEMDDEAPSSMPATVGRAKAAPGKSQWLWKGATTELSATPKDDD